MFAWIALILSFAGIAINIFIYISDFIINREKELSNTVGKTCKKLMKKNDKPVCLSIIFKKNLKDGICPRTDCKGFSCSDSDHSFSAFVKSFVTAFLPEIVTALLALSEILKNGGN